MPCTKHRLTANFTDHIYSNPNYIMKIEIDLLKQTVANWQAQVDYEKKFVGYADPAHVVVLEMQKNRLAKLEGAMKVVKKDRSSTYRFSVNNNENGKKEIADIRLAAKIFNAEERLNAMKNPGYVPKIRKVALFGRLGKNNPNAEIYKERNRGSWRNPYQRIALEDAATIDVYATDYIKRADQWGNRWVTANF